MRVLLVLQATGDNYSVEAGLADNVKQFDHHGEFEHFPPPSNNPNVPVVGPDDIVEVTHMDADTFLTLVRMSGRSTPYVDHDKVAEFDNTGSSVFKDKMDPAHQYIRGISTLAQKLGFPAKPSKTPTDVTSIVNKMLVTPPDEIKRIGKEVILFQEQNYSKTQVAGNGKVGLWVVNDYTSVDPSRPYDDGYVVSIVYRKNRKGMSIYVAPQVNYVFGGKVIAGVPFLGHPKACGSTREHDYTVEDAKRVYEEVVQMVQSGRTAKYLRFRGALYRSVTALRHPKWNPRHFAKELVIPHRMHQYRNMWGHGWNIDYDNFLNSTIQLGPTGERTVTPNKFLWHPLDGELIFGYGPVHSQVVADCGSHDYDEYVRGGMDDFSKDIFIEGWMPRAGQLSKDDKMTLCFEGQYALIYLIKGLVKGRTIVPNDCQDYLDEY